LLAWNFRKNRPGFSQIPPLAWSIFSGPLFSHATTIVPTAQQKHPTTHHDLNFLRSGSHQTATEVKQIVCINVKLAVFSRKALHYPE